MMHNWFCLGGCPYGFGNGAGGMGIYIHMHSKLHNVDKPNAQCVGEPLFVLI